MTTRVSIVRVYVTESCARLERLMQLLRKSGGLRGGSAFRGAAGFGSSTPEGVDASEPPTCQWFVGAAPGDEVCDVAYPYVPRAES